MHGTGFLHRLVLEVGLVFDALKAGIVMGKIGLNCRSSKGEKQGLVQKGKDVRDGKVGLVKGDWIAEEKL